MSNQITVEVGAVSKFPGEDGMVTSDQRRKVTFQGERVRRYRDKDDVDTLYKRDSGGYVVHSERSADDYGGKGGKVTRYQVHEITERDLQPGGNWAHVSPDLPPTPLDDYLRAWVKQGPRLR